MVVTGQLQEIMYRLVYCEVYTIFPSVHKLKVYCNIIIIIIIIIINTS